MGLVARVHIKNMNTVTWMKKNVFFAVHLPMVPVAKAFEPILPVTSGAKAKGVMVFSNGQKTESIDYSKLQFTLVSEQTVTQKNVVLNKIHVALR